MNSENSRETRAVSVATTPGAVQENLRALADATWTFVALGAAFEYDLPNYVDRQSSVSEIAEATDQPVAVITQLLDAMVLAGLIVRDRNGGLAVGEGLRQVIGQSGTELLRATARTEMLLGLDFFGDAIAGRSHRQWSTEDDRLLESIGAMSTGMLGVIERLMPEFGDLQQRLESSSSALLDVGAGVGAGSIGLCQRYPGLRAVALEPAARPTELARRNVSAAGMQDRIELRRQRIQDLGDDQVYDLVWLPSVHIPDAELPAALTAVHRALRPGGWVFTGSFGAAGTHMRSVAMRLRAVAFGGDAPHAEDLAGFMRAAGFVDVRLLDEMHGATSIVARRR